MSGGGADRGGVRVEPSVEAEEVRDTLAEGGDVGARDETAAFDRMARQRVVPEDLTCIVTAVALAAPKDRARAKRLVRLFIEGIGR